MSKLLNQFKTQIETLKGAGQLGLHQESCVMSKRHTMFVRTLSTSCRSPRRRSSRRRWTGVSAKHHQAFRIWRTSLFVAFPGLLAFRVKLVKADKNYISCFESCAYRYCRGVGEQLVQLTHTFVSVLTIVFNDLPEKETDRRLRCDGVGLQTFFFRTITCMSTVLPELVF